MTWDKETEQLFDEEFYYNGKYTVRPLAHVKDFVSQHFISKKELEEETVNIAISAITEWRKLVEENEGGKHESPRFFNDTTRAIKNLKALKEKLEL